MILMTVCQKLLVEKTQNGPPQSSWPLLMLAWWSKINKSIENTQKA